ncbi:tyrosine-protein phosphatase [Kitasatospora sp. NPDC051853]|uniref:tyrosine-protein phosphatase n=1 Tax=Kitasatospora sp. NPDC051853 TaxID=3364058 RepID=UPI0037A4C0A7
MTAREFDAAPPALTVSDVRNFRDAGIAGLRPGLLYRSASLNTLTPEGARQLERLGIRTVIDLRTTAERAAWPDLHHHLDLEDLHHPLLPDQDSAFTWPKTMEATYRAMAELGGPSIAATVRHFAAAESGPTLVHCAVGKDRTGLTIAVLQSLAGLSEADILEDFVRSNPHLGLDTDEPVYYYDEHGTRHRSLPVAPELLHLALDHLRTTHGSLPAYLESHGVTPAEITTVGALLRA